LADKRGQRSGIRDQSTQRRKNVGAGFKPALFLFNRKERKDHKEKPPHAEARRKKLLTTKNTKATKKVTVILREVAESIKTASREGAKTRRRTQSPFPRLRGKVGMGGNS
jgi:hypothetical protein